MKPLHYLLLILPLALAGCATEPDRPGDRSRWERWNRPHHPSSEAPDIGPDGRATYALPIKH